MIKLVSKTVFISTVFSLICSWSVFAHQKHPVVHKSHHAKPTLAQAETGSRSQQSNKDSSDNRNSSSVNSERSSSSDSDSKRSHSSQSNQNQDTDNPSDNNDGSSNSDDKSLPNYPSNPANDNQSSLPNTQQWAVKVGSYTSATELKKSVAQLQKHGFDGFIKEIKNGSKVVSEVYVGPTKERAAAEKLNNKLKQSHIIGKIVPTEFDEKA